MKKYIPFSKETFEEIANKTIDVSVELMSVRKNLRSVQTYSKITEEEYAILTKAIDILNKKTNNLEDLLEDENYQFSNPDNFEHYT